jgi:hypothetical protein
MPQQETVEDCPGTGRQGHMDESAPGDDWYVICPVCNMRWAGGSTIISSHKDWRKR